MQPPITMKILADWAGDQVLRDAESMVKKGLVLNAEYEQPYVKGAVLWNNREFKTSLRILPDGTVENLCPCWANKERGLICSHVIALGVSLVQRATDPQREAKHKEELRKASRLASIDEAQYIRRVSHDTPGAMPAELALTLDSDWPGACRKGYVLLTCEITYRDNSQPADQVPRDIPLVFSKQDESLLFVLEDISEGPAKGRLELTIRDLANIFRMHAGRTIAWAGHDPIQVNQASMTTLLRMDLDRENGELIVIAHTELPFVKIGECPVYVISGRSGWVFGASNLWPLKNVLPEPYHQVYDEPIAVARSDVLRFLTKEIPSLSKHTQIISDISTDLFSIDPATPTFRLVVKGSPASLAATLHARYECIELPACKPDPNDNFGIPDPEDFMRYTVRNLEMEKYALSVLQPAGLIGDRGDQISNITGTRQVLNFLGSHLPALRRNGWRVELEGKVAPHAESLDFATPVVHVSDSAADWFEIGFDFEDGQGNSISNADIQLALRKGDSYIERNGRTILIDSDAVESMLDVFSDCATRAAEEAGHFRMSGVYSAFVKSSLDSLDGIDVEASPTWRSRANQYNRTTEIEPLELDKRLDAILRPYQKEGVKWMRLLQANNFSGLLADEMGLGKTVQTLAWLQANKTVEKNRTTWKSSLHNQEEHPIARNPEGRVPPRPANSSGNLPSLIVCPASLVENWAEEAQRFVPDLTTINIIGPDRAEKWKSLPSTDVAITSYAIMRRDLDRFLEQHFSVVILDEAQHIKNRSTQNALAAKQLKCLHRLVLTGTPIENSVSDLWSIMDFLLPGYLGTHDVFKQNYELPVARGGNEAMSAQTKLKRKLHPFMLRRLRTNVAKDLPRKIQRLATCDLTADQKTVYKHLLESSRRDIAGTVAAKGLNKSRMQILAVLMRLRQTCCHLDLLKLPDLKPRYPSAKMDLFFELLDEALDGGHRILVFSQFVSMLHILRDQLQTRDLTCCYLDGSTKNRMEVVHTFNRERSIPVFLISLKAGGTGLNLTGADMVIHFDPWWNPAVEEQATDRAYRIGQKRTVYSIKLITRGTVEEKVMALQDKKRQVIDATIDSNEKLMQTLSWEDIQELLDM